MKNLFLLIIPLLSIFFSCRKGDLGALESKALVQLPPPGYQLTWSDEFDSKELDLNKWMHRAPGVRRQGFNFPEAVYIDTLTGNLIIKSFMRNDTAFTGMVATRDRYTQKYGYFECRAKIDSISVGHWAAFWLQSPDYGKTLNPVVDGMEIDIMEFVGGNPYVTNHALHWNGYSTNQQSRSSETRSDVRFDNGQYHVYGLEWTPDYYRFFVDSRLVWEVSGPISQRDQYVILSCEVSDKNVFKADFGSKPTNFVIDYVRMYAKK